MSENCTFHQSRLIGVLVLAMLVVDPIAVGAADLSNVQFARGEIPDTCPGGFDAYAIVTVKGLRDQKGNLRVEVYPDSGADFLVNRLGRTQVPTPKGQPKLCVELPGPGKYAIVVHQDRNADNSFDLFKDGFGFSNNPKLGLSVPDLSEVEFRTTGLVTYLTVDLHYLFPKQTSRTRHRRH